MSKKEKIKTFKSFCRKHWRKWTILAILVMIVFIGFVFYQYIYKPLYQSKEIVPKKLEIRKDVYQDVMDLYFERQSNVEEIINKTYPDIFR